MVALKKKDTIVIDREQKDSRILFVVIDGLGDRTCPEYPLTVLQKANTPNLDKMAKKGVTGLMHPINIGVRPGSGVAHLAIFGYNPSKYYTGRGSLAALGVGIKLQEGEVAVRTNFATIKKGKLVDRRAGRIGEEEAKPLAKALNKITLTGVKTRFEYVKEYRGVLILSGKDLVGKITDSDPSVENEQPRKVFPLDPRARKTTEKVNEFIAKAAKVLAKHPINAKRRKQGKPEANFILTRGGGEFFQADGFKKRYGLKAACIADYPQYIGVARFVGMTPLEYDYKPYDYRDIKAFEANLKKKFRKSIEALKKFDFVFLHLKETDEAGEDGDFKTKVKLIEAIDRQVSLLLKGKQYLVVTSDHSTPCCIKAHSGDPVAVMIYGNDVRKDDVNKFDEISCGHGGLGHIKGLNLMPLLLDKANRLKKYGP